MENSGLLLEIRHLTKVFGKDDSHSPAVDDVDLDIEAGASLALVGESGSGKSTVARMVCGLEKATGGSIRFEGQELVGATQSAMRNAYRDMQMVFQNPTDSFNPRRRLGSSIIDALLNIGVGQAQASARLPELLERVGLGEGFARRYPSEVSGGECQRAAIARAMAIEPHLLICDECTSALDVNVQAQIVSLLEELKEKEGLSLLFICHDLALIQGLCERTAVMSCGSIVELGDTRAVVSAPLHPYTQLMLASVFPAMRDTGWHIPEVRTRDEVSVGGCGFFPRCVQACGKCGAQKPPRFIVENAYGRRSVACWRFEGEKDARRPPAEDLPE